MYSINYHGDFCLLLAVSRKAIVWSVVAECTTINTCKLPQGGLPRNSVIRSLIAIG